ncbi:MAG: Myo-inositol 2-dehydrogenase [Elusimicrobia bacterium]|nr:Myo-inositol 2-dehydrogenase [Elusimicrobiota bacterium]
MRCIVFGYGYMGRIRAKVLQQHPDVTDLKIYDPALESHSKDIVGSLLSPSERIPWNQFDAAFICTPNNVTADLCVQAIKNCRNVFCEKPPGRNWDDFSRIAEAAQSVPDHRVVFGFNHRLHPSVVTAKSLLKGGSLGPILYMKGTYGKSGGVHYRQSWRNDKQVSGGGILLDQGIHMLDIFLNFLGPCQVSDVILNDAFWKCGVEDNAFLLLRSETGVPAFLHSSATLWKHTFRFEIGCENGYLIATGLLSRTGSYGREQLVIGKRQFEDEAFALGNPREEIIHFDRDESWDKEVQEFIASIKEKRPPTHGTLDEARQVMEIIRDVYAKRDVAPVRRG